MDTDFHGIGFRRRTNTKTLELESTQVYECTTEQFILQNEIAYGSLRFCKILSAASRVHPWLIPPTNKNAINPYIKITKAHITKRNLFRFYNFPKFLSAASRVHPWLIRLWILDEWSW